MSSENSGEKKDVVDASERVLALAAQRHADGAKLAKAKEEMQTPKDKAEAIVVDSLESAGRFVTALLSARAPEGSTAGEMAAHAQYAKTQAQLAQWVIESAMGIASGKPNRAAHDIVRRIQAQSIGATLAKRLAEKQSRPRIVEQAIPAQNDTHDVDTTHSDAADGGGNE